MRLSSDSFFDAALGTVFTLKLLLFFRYQICFYERIHALLCSISVTGGVGW
jgi:hypothetical protein